MHRQRLTRTFHHDPNLRIDREHQKKLERRRRKRRLQSLCVVSDKRRTLCYTFKQVYDNLMEHKTLVFPRQRGLRLSKNERVRLMKFLKGGSLSLYTSRYEVELHTRCPEEGDEEYFQRRREIIRHNTRMEQQQ